MAKFDCNNNGKKDWRSSFWKYQLYTCINYDKNSNRAYDCKKQELERIIIEECNGFSILIISIIAALSVVFIFKYLTIDNTDLQILCLILGLITALCGGFLLSSDFIRKDEYRLDQDKRSYFKLRFILFIVAVISLVLTLKYMKDPPKREKVSNVKSFYSYNSVVDSNGEGIGSANVISDYNEVQELKKKHPNGFKENSLDDNPFDVQKYDDPEQFYEDNEDYFENYEEAEDFYDINKSLQNQI